jgi:hypothetical protein
MGSVNSCTWFIYSRDKDDTWSDTPIASTLVREEELNYHLGRFKHVVFKMCTDNLGPIRKVYLYHGWRVAKAEVMDNLLCLFFATRVQADQWWEVEEECIETGVYSRAFAQHWRAQDGPSDLVIRYERRKVQVSG